MIDILYIGGRILNARQFLSAITDKLLWHTIIYKILHSPYFDAWNFKALWISSCGNDMLFSMGNLLPKYLFFLSCLQIFCLTCITRPLCHSLSSFLSTSHCFISRPSFLLLPGVYFFIPWPKMFSKFVVCALRQPPLLSYVLNGYTVKDLELRPDLPQNQYKWPEKSVF